MKIFLQEDELKEFLKAAGFDRIKNKDFNITDEDVDDFDSVSSDENPVKSKIITKKTLPVKSQKTSRNDVKAGSKIQVKTNSSKGFDNDSKGNREKDTKKIKKPDSVQKDDKGTLSKVC